MGLGASRPDKDANKAVGFIRDSGHEVALKDNQIALVAIGQIKFEKKNIYLFLQQGYKMRINKTLQDTINYEWFQNSTFNMESCI